MPKSPSLTRHLSVPILLESFRLRYQFVRKRVYILAIFTFYIALLFDAPLLWRWEHVVCKTFCDLSHMNICLKILCKKQHYYLKIIIHRVSQETGVRYPLLSAEARLTNHSVLIHGTSVRKL